MLLGAGIGTDNGIDDGHGPEGLAAPNALCCESPTSDNSREWLRVRVAIGPVMSMSSCTSGNLLGKPEEEDAGTLVFFAGGPSTTPCPTAEMGDTGTAVTGSQKSQCKS